MGRGERGPLTYESLPKKSEGWKNHNERVLKFYLEMFPETDLYTLLEQTGDFLNVNGNGPACVRLRYQKWRNGPPARPSALKKMFWSAITGTRSDA